MMWDRSAWNRNLEPALTSPRNQNLEPGHEPTSGPGESALKAAEAKPEAPLPAVRTLKKRSARPRGAVHAHVRGAVCGGST